MNREMTRLTGNRLHARLHGNAQPLYTKRLHVGHAAGYTPVARRLHVYPHEELEIRTKASLDS
jgi:hypothetical protein